MSDAFIDDLKGSVGVAVLLMLAVFPIPIFGTDTAAFLQPSLDPRGCGLGRSYGVLAEDSAALAWNPAGLSGSGGTHISVGGAQLFETDYYYARLSFRFDDWGVGVGVRSASIGGSQQTVFNPVTGIYEPTGDTLSFRGRAYRLGVARQLTPQVSVGVTSQMVEQVAAGFRSAGFSGNAGISWRLKDWLRLSAYGRHLVSSRLKWNTPAEPSERLGRQFSAEVAAWLFDDRLIVVAGLDHLSSLSTSRLHGGLEYWIAPQFAIRAGVYPGEISIGSSLALTPIRLDFVVTTYSNNVLSNSYQLGVGLDL